MNSSPCMLLSALLACACSGPAVAAFDGVADPAAFTIANTGTLLSAGAPPALGTATFGANQLALVGPTTDHASLGCTGGAYSVLASPCQVQVTLAVPGAYRFDWSYVTADADGPGGDIFGVVIDGNRIALSDLGGAVAQLGSATFAATSSFGWFINCTDCIGGFATATVSGFSVTPVPEPAAGALLLAGLLGTGIARRRSCLRRS